MDITLSLYLCQCLVEATSLLRPNGPIILHGNFVLRLVVSNVRW